MNQSFLIMMVDYLPNQSIKVKKKLMMFFKLDMQKKGATLAELGLIINR